MEFLRKNVDRPWVRWVVGILAPLLSFLAVHGARVARNWQQAQWEDDAFFKHDAEVITSLRDCFTAPNLYPGLYRPLSTHLYYYAGRIGWNHALWGYHLLNGILFLANGFLLIWICLEFFEVWWAVLAGCLWVSRVAAIEVVTNTCEAQGLLYAFFGLLSLKLFIIGSKKHRFGFVAWAFLSFLLALFSKEAAISIPPILFAYCWLFEDRKKCVWTLPFMAAAAAFVLALPRLASGRNTGFGYETSPLAWLRNLGGHALDFMNLVVLPVDDLAMASGVKNAIASPIFWLLTAVVFSCLVYAASVHARWRNLIAPRTALFGMAFFVIACLPFVFFRDRLFMRYSYFGHAGLSILGAAWTRSAFGEFLAIRAGRLSAGKPK